MIIAWRGDYCDDVAEALVWTYWWEHAAMGGEDGIVVNVGQIACRPSVAAFSGTTDRS